jgi:hypothetical protein
VTRTIEKWYPVACGLPIGAAIGYAVFHFRFVTDSDVKDVFTVVLNVSAIVAGFLGTALSVLLTIENRPVIKDLKDAGCYVPLLTYLLSAVRWSFILVVLSTCGLAIFTRIGTHSKAAFLVTWFAVSGVTLLASWRVVQLFGQVVQATGDGEKSGSRK